MNYVFVKSRLPAEYQEVEFIESHGNEYIDLELRGNIDLAIEFTMQLTELSSPPIVLMGSRDSDRVNAYLIAITLALTYKYAQIDNATITTIIDYPPDLNKTKYYLDKEVFKVNNTISRTFSDQTNFVTSRNLTLFKGFTGINTEGFAKGRLFDACKLWSIGKIVRHYIPCFRRSDNVIGLYDLCGSVCPLTGTPFYINAGTGAFTKGPNVQELIPFYIARKTGEFSQLIQNGNFENTSGWLANIGKTVISVANNICKSTYVTNPTESYEGGIRTRAQFTSGDIYLVSFWLKTPKSTNIAFYSDKTGYSASVSATANTWVHYTARITATGGGVSDAVLFTTQGNLIFQTGDVVEYKECQLIDLTVIFGSSNEPTTYAEARRRIKLLTGRDIAYYQQYDGLNQAICGPTAIYGG